MFKFNLLRIADSNILLNYDDENCGNNGLKRLDMNHRKQILPLVHKGEFPVYTVPGYEFSGCVWSAHVTAIWCARHLETSYCDEAAMASTMLLRF